jgi:hypothetical protein
MRRILFDSLMRRPLTEAAPVKDEQMLAELGASVARAAAAFGPQSLDSGG